MSKRSQYPFVKVNCGAIPDNLLESELFGYEKGAFTGALNKGKSGLFELANKGTLFLDEIGELPLNLQVKLLQTLQDRKIFRVGGSMPIPVDIKIIAATNKNLEEMVENNLFREDLLLPPCGHPAVRSRAERTLIQLGTKGAGTPSKGPVPQGLRPSDPGLKNYEYNIEKAKELFKQAGVDPKGLKLELTHAAENEVEKRFAPLLKESFAQLGIDLEVKPILWNQQWQLAKGDPKKAQDIFVLLWWPSFSDGYDNLKGMFHSEDAPSFNLAYWYNKDFDKLIDDAYALSGTDKAKSKELYHQAQQMLIDEAPAMYFFDAKKNLPMNANLEGEGTNPNYANVIFFNRLKTK